MHSTYCCILEQRYHMGESSSFFSRQPKLLSAVRCRCLQITQLLESVWISIAPFIIRLLTATYPDHLIHSMIYKQGQRQTGKAVIEGIQKNCFTRQKYVLCLLFSEIPQFALQVSINWLLNRSSLRMAPVQFKIRVA